MKKTIASPVSDKERIALLDVLRGLAIFGILMVNMQIFYRPMTSMLLGFTDPGSGLQLFSEIFIKFFFEGKFYVLFSLLFGYGFFIFMNKSTEDGQSILPVYRRRVLYLLLFGILHVVLLWPGDILIFYALFGLLLLLFRKVSDRGLIKWAVGLTILPVLLTSLIWIIISFALKIPEAAEQIEAGMQENVAATRGLVERASAVYAEGTFSQILKMRLIEYRVMLPGVLFFYPVVLAMFLLGNLAARKGLVKNLEGSLPFFRRALWWGLGLGVPFNILYVIAYLNSGPQQMDVFTALSSAGHAFGGFFLSLFYISAIVLLVHKGKLKNFAKLIIPVGRMALTNYLLHSIICTTLFYSYGFGLMGKINPFQGIILTVLIFILQILFSRFWLNRFHYGPFEWLWRSLTYLKAQPFVKAKMAQHK